MGRYGDEVTPSVGGGEAAAGASPATKNAQRAAGFQSSDRSRFDSITYNTQTQAAAA